MVRLVLRAAERTAGDVPALMFASDDSVAMIETLFAGIADRSRNHEHRYAIQSLIDRSHAVRIAEARLMPALADDDLAGIAALLAERHWPEIRRWNARFHSVRRRRLTEIVNQFQHR